MACDDRMGGLSPDRKGSPVHVSALVFQFVGFCPMGNGKIQLQLRNLQVSHHTAFILRKLLLVYVVRCGFAPVAEEVFFLLFFDLFVIFRGFRLLFLSLLIRHGIHGFGVTGDLLDLRHVGAGIKKRRSDKQGRRNRKSSPDNSA